MTVFTRTSPEEFFWIHPKAVSQHYECAWAGAEIVHVWEHEESHDQGLPPDYSCCTRCSEMVDNRTGEVIT